MIEGKGLLRYIKIVLMALYAVFCIAYGTGNVLNLEIAHGTVATVASQEENELFPNKIVPPIESPFIVGMALFFVILLEYTAGLLAAVGAWKLWIHRQANEVDFHRAKGFALMGCAVGFVVWFGLFQGVGGAVLYMYQGQLGYGVLNFAFQYSTASALLFLLIHSQTD